jgi:hypothetical protein
VAKDTVSTVSRKHSGVIADAWCSHNRQLAARFSQAVRKARVELKGGNFASIVRRAWALDPELRELFGAAVSSGLRKMWSDVGLRAQQSARTKQTYTAELRKQRSETLKKNWADAGFREKMMRSSARLPNGRFGSRDDVKGVCND